LKHGRDQVPGSRRTEAEAGPSRGLWGPVGHSEARGGVAAMIE